MVKKAIKCPYCNKKYVNLGYYLSNHIEKCKERSLRTYSQAKQRLDIDKKKMLIQILKPCSLIDSFMQLDDSELRIIQKYLRSFFNFKRVKRNTSELIVWIVENKEKEKIKELREKHKNMCEYFESCNINTKNFCLDIKDLEDSKAYCVIRRRNQIVEKDKKFPTCPLCYGALNMTSEEAKEKGGWICTCEGVK